MSIYRAALRLLTPAAEPDLLTELKVKKNIAQHEQRRVLGSELIQVDEHLDAFVKICKTIAMEAAGCGRSSISIKPVNYGIISATTSVGWRQTKYLMHKLKAKLARENLKCSCGSFVSAGWQEVKIYGW